MLAEMVSIARQQWRARIETYLRQQRRHLQGASPASNGGRGLKQDAGLSAARAIKASPASNGGRGLKLLPPVSKPLAPRIARQQWRARIETDGIKSFCAI